jgi:hypothetical protein
MLDVLGRGVQRVLLGTQTTLSPEDVLAGRIVVLDLPLKEWGSVGLLIQVIWKMLFQRAVERRDIAANRRPVFCWIDEAHHFLTSGDALFQTTCRSSRCATVMLSQGLPGFHSAFGDGDKGKAETASLLGNLTTKIFHANGCTTTNEYSANLIGRTRQFMVNSSSSFQSGSGFPGMSGSDGGRQGNAGISETFELEVQPNEFSTLRTGGPENRLEVDAVVYHSGKRFKRSGKTWQLVTFKQS